MKTLLTSKLFQFCKVAALPLQSSKQACYNDKSVALGSGLRYQILLHVFARCASQKTYSHARIARYSCMAVGLHAILAWL